MEQETYVAFPSEGCNPSWLYRSNDLDDLVERVRWMLDGSSTDKKILIAKVIGSVREVKVIDFEKFEQDVSIPIDENDVE